MDFKVDNEIKQEYLSTKPAPTAESDAFILRSADEYEEMVGKSIYDMSYVELKEMIAMQFRNFSEGAVRKNVSILKKYIDFCIEKNIVTHGENRLAIFRSKDAKEYVDQKALLNKYISRERLREYQNILYNEQDKLLLELAYLGVNGRAQEEIINLTIDDVDENNKMLTLTTNDGEHRLLAVDLSTIGLIIDTYNQEFYVENNGEITENIRIPEPRRTRINKVENYVFRVPGKNKFEKFTATLLGSRMNRFKLWLDNPYLTYTSLRDSGMVQMAMDIYDRKGKVTKEDYLDICDQYNYGDCNTVRILFEQYKDLLRK